MTTDPQSRHGDSDCCADLHQKVDRMLEILEDLHKARKIHLRPEDVTDELSIGTGGRPKQGHIVNTPRFQAALEEFRQQHERGEVQ